MFSEYLLIQKLLASILVGYLLGSIPFAHVAARLNGVDIFATGSKTAGAANVFWNISRRIAVVVFLGDVAKGALAVTVASLLEIHGPLVLLAAAAAIIGHWNSLFTGFRGGDGMATLLGITITLIPALTLSGIIVGLGAVLVLRRSPFRSVWGIATCFAVILVLSLYYDDQRSLVLGLVALAMFVLWHSVIGRQRRLRLNEREEMELDLDTDAEPESDLSTAAPENR